MKQISHLLILILFSSFAAAQTGAPQLINYQGIARTSGGGILASANIDVQFNIRQGSAGGSVVFNETHSSIPTNAFGLFTIQIGSASSLSAVSWGTNKFYLEVLIDAGSGFNPAGPPQELISTPYALYAQQTPPPNVTFTNNLLSINGSTVMLPGGSSYTAGAGIDVTGSVITNTAPDQTVNIASGNNAIVSGAYPSYTVDVLNASLNFNNATNELSLTQGTNVSTTTINVGSSATTISAGSANVQVSGGPAYVISVDSPTITGTGIAVITPTAGSSFNINVPSSNLSYTAGSGILQLTQGTAVSSVTIPSSPSPSITGTGIAVVTPTSGSSFNVNVPSSNLSYTAGSGILQLTQGSAVSSVTIPSAVTPTITGSGIAQVTPLSGNSFTVNVPPPVLSLNSNSLTITQGTASSTQTIAPSPWIKPTAAVVTLANSADYVGIGVSPSSKLDIFESSNIGGKTVLNALHSSSASVGANSAIYSDLLGYSSGNYMSGYFRSELMSTGTGNPTALKGLAISSNSGVGLVTGVEGSASGGSQNYGVTAFSNGGAGTVNYGVYSDVSGSGFNYGIYSTATGANNWAGYFVGHSLMNGKLAMQGQTTAPLAGSGQGTIYYDNTSQKLKVSENGQPYINLLGWGLQGNSGTNATSDFIGTTDAASLIFRTNNTQKMVLTSAGNVGINVTNPGYRLSVVERSGSNAAIFASQSSGLTSASAHGISGLTSANNNLAAGVYGDNTGSGPAVYGNKTTSTGPAGRFDVQVAGSTADALVASTIGSGAAIHAIAGTASSSVALLIENGHIKSIGNAAVASSVAIQSGFSSLSVACTSCTDVKGKVTCTAPSTGVASLTGLFRVSVTFNKPYSIAPTVVIIPASNPSALTVYVSAVSTTSFQVTYHNNTNGSLTGLPASFTFNYIVIE